MEQKIAQKITKAIVNTNHPLLDFRSKEAQKQICWIHKYLKKYILKECKFLDIGCGTGKQSFAAERMGAEVVGIDCSQEAIVFANNIKTQLHSNCQFILGNYTKMPFSKNTFDIAIFPNNIIECSYNELEKISNEVNKILNNNGKLIITMRDEAKNIIKSKNLNFSNYCVKTGQIKEKITIPNKKQYSYPIYFWTVSFAKHILSNNFKLLEEKKININQYLLIFIKKPQ